MFGFSAGVGEVTLVALPALLALPAVIAVGTAAGFVVPGFPAIAPLPPRREKGLGPRGNKRSDSFVKKAL
jgi:hypothetical protein